MACNSLTSGLVARDNCNLALGGTTGRVVLINKDDIATQTVANGVLTALTLAESKTGYAFVGMSNNANVGSYEFAQGTYGSGSYSHSVQLRDFIGGADAYNFVKGLKGARVVAILEINYGGEDADKHYQVYGLENGLILTADTGTTEMTDNVVGDITLASSESSRENNRPITMFSTDYATTKTLFESLATFSE